MSDERLFCEFPECGVSVRLDLAGTGLVQTVMADAARNVQGNLLPPLRLTATESDLEPVAAVALAPSGGRVLVSFCGEVAIEAYETDAQRARWDCWRALSAALRRALLGRGVVTFHAACVQAGDRLWLIAGESGAGKSSIAFLARASGCRALASELALVRDGALVAGNGMLCIERSTVAALGIPLRGDEFPLDDVLSAPADRPTRPMPVWGVLFPTIGGAFSERRLEQAAARKLLYENAIRQLDCAGLVGAAVVLPPSADDLAHVELQAERLADVGAVAVAGPLHPVWASLAQA